MKDLKKLIDFSFYSLLPLAILSLVFSLLSDSLTVFTVTFDSILSLIVNFFAFYSIRSVLKQNVFTFPYGTGKLENFISFLYGSLLIPTSAFIVCFAIHRIIHPPHDIKFDLTQVPLVPQLARSIFLFVWTRKMLSRSKNTSPMLHSYHTTFKVCTLADIVMVVSMAIAFVLVKTEYKNIGYMIDPVLSCVIALYMLYCGINLLVTNFKSLISLPLPEEDQLKILKVLTNHFDAYETLGNVYSHKSGSTSFIEIELGFKDTSTEEILKLKKNLKIELSEFFNDLRFNLILIPCN